MLIADTHADTLYRLAAHPGDACDITPERLRRGGVNLQTLALFVGGKPDRESIGRMMDASYRKIALFQDVGVRQLLDPRDAREGETAFMLSVEGCDLLADDLRLIERWRGMGVRIAALTWNHVNACGTPAMKGDERLPAFGARAAKALQAAGIAVDVSHLCEKAFYDLLDLGLTPMASHSCCRALCDTPRNLTDAQLKALFAAGGYVGVNFYPWFLRGGVSATLEDIAAHIEHMLSLGGEDHIGFGSDFDGIEVKPDGLQSPADLPRLIDCLRGRGIAPSQIEKIAGRNLPAYFDRVFPRGET